MPWLIQPVRPHFMRCCAICWATYCEGRLASPRQQVVVTADHDKLNAHVYVKLASSPTCYSGLEDQAAEYVLQRCQLLRTASHTVADSTPATHQTQRPRVQQAGAISNRNCGLKTQRLRIYCTDARFCRQQDKIDSKTTGVSDSSPATHQDCGRKWRRLGHIDVTDDMHSQSSGHREEGPVWR